MVTLWKIGAAHAAREQDITHKCALHFGRIKHHMPGCMAGAMTYLQYMLTQGDGITILEPTCGLERPGRGKAVSGCRHGKAVYPKLIPRMRSDDGQAQAICQILRRCGMVHMGMGNPNLLQRYAHFFGGRYQQVQITTGVDDRSLMGLIAPDYGAVLFKRGDRNCFVVEHVPSLSSAYGRSKVQCTIGVLADSAMSNRTQTDTLKPTVESFARIAGLEALCRGCTLSVFPLLLYRAWGSAQLVSEIYFCVGLLSLTCALLVPALTRIFTRRQVYLGAVSLYLVASGFGALQGKWTTLALVCAIAAAAVSFVCYNSYVLDHLEKSDFSRLETMRLLYGGAGWVVGPFAGVWLLSLGGPAPFVLLGLAASAMLWLIWKTPLGDGKFQARKASNTAEAAHDSRRANPLALVVRFFSQPRLVTAWLIPLVRSCGWWMFFVYLGIFALENKLGEQVGGVSSSVANMGLFLAPLMLVWMQKRSVRTAIRVGCLGASACYLLAAILSYWPWVTIGFLLAGTIFLVLLDTCAGLPFLMSVKPSERTEMSAVYSSFRDVSGIVSPAIAWVVLQFAPVVGVFAVGALILLGACLLAGRLHPELGVPGAIRQRNAA